MVRSEHNERTLITLTEIHGQTQGISHMEASRCLKRLEEELAHLPEFHSAGKAVLMGCYALQGWSATSKKAPSELVKKCHRTLVKKHYDYGTQSLIKFKQWGFIVKMDMKIQRLRNLLNKVVPQNEPISDTWLDLVGYSVLFAMWCRGQVKEKA